MGVTEAWLRVVGRWGKQVLALLLYLSARGLFRVLDRILLVNEQ